MAANDRGTAVNIAAYNIIRQLVQATQLDTSIWCMVIILIVPKMWCRCSRSCKTTQDLQMSNWYSTLLLGQNQSIERELHYYVGGWLESATSVNEINGPRTRWSLLLLMAGSLAYLKIQMMTCTFAMWGWRTIRLWIDTFKTLVGLLACL